MMQRPKRSVCSLCVLNDDAITTLHLGDGVWQHTCRGPGHTEPRVWQEESEAGVDELALEGLTLEWRLYDDLPKCLVPGEGFVEYGVVEHRYKLLNPSRYSFLVDRYGHTRQGPKNYTATSFIAGALGRLGRRGDLDAKFGDAATGYWSYNRTISYWMLPKSAAHKCRTTWEEFAHANGLDPADWELP
jgi:hypothetical protein